MGKRKGRLGFRYSVAGVLIELVTVGTKLEDL
jgi:hypothetical protein